MKRGKKLIAVPALALTAGIGLAACGNSGPALTAGSATASQVCQSMVGQPMQNTLTGQNNGETVSSYTSGSGSIQSNLNSSGNEVVSCDYTLSTGGDYPSHGDAVC